jgi:hypothetical protein
MTEIERIRKLLTRNRRRGILVDANMLLLKFVGDCMPQGIQSFKRTRQFTVDDYQSLQILLHNFKRIVTTPHILTEVSDLAGQIDDRRRGALFSVFASGIALLSEEFVTSAEISSTPAFTRLGLTDAAIGRIASSKMLVLTVDLPLWVFLHEQRIDVLNFNHIRHLNWR